MFDWSRYQSQLTQNCNDTSPLLCIFSEQKKVEIWRQLWTWLADAQKQLGLPQVTDEMVDELERNKCNIDKEFIASETCRLKHDVMANIHAYAKVCPTAASIIHLGVSSCYLQDNADLIRQRMALDYILKHFANTMQILAQFSQKHATTVTVGRTHWQTASLITVGKRGALWLQEMLMVFKKLVDFRESMRFLAIKGSTGSQDTFLTLFNGDDAKVRQMDEMISEKAGFKSFYTLTGQTYPRQQDTDLLFIFSQFGAATQKICKDICFLQSHGELMESSNKDQVGSSAMPYKRNPVKSERVCSLARKLMLEVLGGLMTSADQGLERRWDDADYRRFQIPDAFFCTDIILNLLQCIFNGLRVPASNAQKVRDELPFLALDKVMMLLSLNGVDYLEAHATTTEVALDAKARQERGEKISLEEMLADPLFNPVREQVSELAKEPINFVGTCVRQVEDFLRDEYHPVVAPFIQSIPE